MSCTYRYGNLCQLFQKFCFIALLNDTFNLESFFGVSATVMYVDANKSITEGDWWRKSAAQTLCQSHISHELKRIYLNYGELFFLAYVFQPVFTEEKIRICHHQF